MGPSIPYFEVVGNGRQDAGDVLQGGGSGGDSVQIEDVGHYSAHKQDTGGDPPSGGTPDYGKTTVDGCVWDLEVPPSGCVDGGGITGGGGYLCFPPPEHGRTLYHYLSDYIPVSRRRAAPWGKGVQEVVVTR